MKIAIMQPYFCSYIGYYQLIRSVDKFVICDNMQYTKKGWFNRNRILNNGNPKTFTIPLKKGSDYLNANQRYLAKNTLKDKNSILTQIQSFYKKAPFFEQNYPVIRELFLKDIDNLFDFIHYSVITLCNYLNIKTEIIVCSSLDIDHELKSHLRVLEICKFLNADVYINSIGGKELYSKSNFKKEGIELKFINSKKIEYEQFKYKFVPWLSIIDVLMFNSTEKIYEMLNKYDLI